jgi:hypothetical protein
MVIGVIFVGTSVRRHFVDGNVDKTFQKQFGHTHTHWMFMMICMFKSGLCS